MKDATLDEMATEMLGEEKGQEFLNKFGLGKTYKPPERKYYMCENCHGYHAYFKEIHPDVPGMNEIVLHCSKCKHEKSQ